MKELTMKRTYSQLITAAVAATLLIAFGLPPRAARAQSATYYSTPVYFPTPGPEPAGSGILGVPATGIPADGKMLALAGAALNTLAGQSLTLGIGAPRDATYLRVSIFDADTSGAWDLANAPDDTPFALYADPSDSGHPNTASAVTGLNPVTSALEPGPWSGNAMAADPTTTSNGWSTVVIPLVPSDPTATNPARNPITGNYFYQLRATLTDPAANAYNAFKIRVQAVFGSPSASQAAISLNEQAFAFICPNAWPTAMNTDGKFSAYDGVWNFYMEVPGGLDNLAVWDGDMDCGAMNPDGTWDMASMDTGDVDTNNAVPYDPQTGSGVMKFSQVAPNAGEWVPYWAEGTGAVTQGAPSFDGQKHGSSPGPGASIQDPRLIPNPADNNTFYRPNYVRRTVQPYLSATPAPGEPGICYSVFDPLGRQYANLNPSGNREWEQFKIAVDAAAQGPLPLDPGDSRRSQEDYVTNSLPAGIYLTQLRGVDVSNLNALHIDYRLLGVTPNGNPDPPLATQVVVGDTVFHDYDGDGIQEPTAPGIPGVTMELRDPTGNVAATAMTDGNGKYQFTLPWLDFVNGTNWTVDVAASNFASGGVLRGLEPTTVGGNAQTHLVKTDDLTFDFGYVGPVCSPTVSAITSNFNATPVAAGRTLWFSSVIALKLATTPAKDVHLTFTNVAIQLPRPNGTSQVLTVPSAEVIVSLSATTTTTTFVGGRWVTTIPLGVVGKRAFLTGLPFVTPDNSYSGAQNIVWSGGFASDTPGVSVQWLWAAAVYTQFTSSYNSIGVKPTDDNQASQYKNSDHAGTPENFKQYVTGGARGGGGSDFTGSYSGTASATPCVGSQ